MSREIKFRAWDKQWLQMSTPMELFKNGQSFLFFKGWGTRAPNNESLELMQFTGLLDKNGKEIYEGDIVKDLEGKILICLWSGFGYFEWMDYRAWVDGFYDAYLDTKDITPLNRPTTLEVIGNTYENKELIPEYGE